MENHLGENNMEEIHQEEVKKEGLDEETSMELEPQQIEEETKEEKTMEEDNVEIQIMDEAFSKQLEEKVIKEEEEKQKSCQPQEMKDVDEEEDDLFKTHEFKSKPSGKSIKASVMAFFSMGDNTQKTDTTLENQELYKFPTNMRERARFIPLRITQPERKMLRLLEAALHVSKYSDKVDQIKLIGKPQRLQEQLKGIASLLNGILIATQPSEKEDYSDVLNTFSQHEDVLQAIFEIGRRYKIMNPDRMRDDYAKLIFILQDITVNSINEELGVSLLRPVETVYRYLERKDLLKILDDELIEIAVSEIIPDNKSKSQIQDEIKRKENAIKVIAKKYSTMNCDEEEIKQCLYSIADNNCYLRYNRDPVVKTIHYLEKYFDPNEAKEPRFSLAINEGNEGSRLSHDHAKQFLFVKQTLVLWNIILENMYQLWILAELDLFDPQHPYEMKNTGQGYHRLQQSPRISLVMHRIVKEMQEKVGNWVGSAQIHLGDHNVPNALVFIDKYTQISRFLGPIVTTLENLEKIGEKNAHVKNYIIKTFGSYEELRMIILTDFFKHAFDGSGADNFYDAGSCIDGRLTSAWNWCSSVDKKEYYPIFQLAGFTGFDGAFA
ncbi:hypothetical protein ENUP19_0248G0067 [Entamoeba nuttalli]|uniref:Non-canonical E2 ubiquitin-conjugating enzyme C-terminal domain-containing protein n=2 Tax=Entamoeba nuttalli TaxID=412467 RepID=K2H5D5_ENTNP|nr:hypothetical protein ENU1_190780 [Entamoeba nuttalli P19]EKE37639.1 hypothetical protein ENU1_190780 [Entamoeba nuttalli P19]|eukprot:XP_008860027.1 hypothetical protein ENU1_190780 [Entamoeba nuttalli P19]